MIDYYRKDAYGRVEWQAVRSMIWVVTTSVLYALLAAMVIVYVWHVPAYLFPGLLAVCFFIWRIHRLHSPVVLACETELLILASGGFMKKGSWIDRIFRPVYLVVSYTEIAGFSHRWNAVYLGTRTEGGLTSAAVPLAFLSKRDKAHLTQLIEEKQRQSRIRRFGGGEGIDLG